MAFKTGVIFIEGKPGAGKSFKGTEELLRIITQERRPVYSNLPLRERSLKRYLKSKVGADAYLNLWRPLTQEHFRAHVERAVRIDHEYAQWKERTKQLGHNNYSRDAFDRWYEKEHPDDRAITQGPGANWIQTGAAIIIDEVHLWTGQQGAKKDDDLLAYASMHRHHHHLIYLLTQDTMQAALEWRRQCISVIVVDDASSIRLFANYSLATFGLKNKVARYAYFNWEHYQIAKASNRRDVQADKVELRWLPFNSHIFSLYDSYGRTGISRRKQAKIIEATARETGVPIPKQSHINFKKHRPKRTWRLLYRTTRKLVWSALFIGTGYIAATAIHSNEPQQQSTEQTDALPSHPTPGAVETIGPDWIRIAGRRYQRGTRYGNEYMVFQIDQENGYAVLVHRDVGPAWLLVPGREPATLGPTDRFMAQVHDELRRSVTRDGPDTP